MGGSWRTARRVGALACVTVAAWVACALPGTAGGAPAATAGYSTRGLWVVDAQGRDLFLRGVDVTGAEDTPTSAPLPYGPADFAAIRASGATVVRLPIAWAMIEPTPGRFDAGAIARAVQIVHWAGAAGLHVVLDMHQYLWTPCFGGNGMPTWTVPNCPAVPPSNVALQEADILVAQNTFWHSPALQADFAAAWVAVAQAVGTPDYLLGYDILNEPGPGFIPNEVFEEDFLAPFYRAVGADLRRVYPGALLFVEPSILNGLVNGSSQFLQPIGLPGVVFEPHQYGAVSLNADSVLGVADLAGPAQFGPDLTVDTAVARRMHAAVWLGEWGAINPAVSLLPTQYVRDDLSAQDAVMLGSAYWSYDSSLRGPNTAIGAQLRRVAPFAIAGTPVAIETGTASMHMTWVADGGLTLVSSPSGCSPNAIVRGGPAAVSAEQGGYLGVQGSAGVEYSMTVQCTEAPGANS